MKKHKQRGTGYRQYSDEYLYGTLGLYNLHVHRIGRAQAKAVNPEESRMRESRTSGSTSGRWKRNHGED
jgi:hypothetical protein